MKKWLIVILSLPLLTACTQQPQQPQPREFQDGDGTRTSRLLIYLPVNPNDGAVWHHTLDKEGIVESVAPKTGQSETIIDENGEEQELIYMETMPGGDSLIFVGKSPGEVQVSCHYGPSEDKDIALEIYNVRVYDDLELEIVSYSKG